METEKGRETGVPPAARSVPFRSSSSPSLLVFIVMKRPLSLSLSHTGTHASVVSVHLCALIFFLVSLQNFKTKKKLFVFFFFSTKIFYYSKSRPGHEELSFPRCQCFTKFRPIKRIPLKRFFSHHLHHHVDSFENLFFSFFFSTIVICNRPAGEREPITCISTLLFPTPSPRFPDLITRCFDTVGTRASSSQQQVASML